MDFFCLTNFAKNTNLSTWFLFGMTLGVDSFLRHFGVINKQQNGEQKLGWNVYYWYLFTQMENL